LKIKKILVLGATGYVGTRLVNELLTFGYHVRAGSRSKLKLQNRNWSNHTNVELCEVNVLDNEQLGKALDGVDVVYYLVHSMNPETTNFEETDKQAAMNMRNLAEEYKIKLIVYLGGLGDEKPSLSLHLKSRNQVGLILQNGKVPVTIFRAAMIIGSSSASFEILRYLVDRLPIMITPRWVHTKNQPISIRNVLNYLVQCLDVPETYGNSYDIGGPEVLSYSDLMQIYAKEAGLRKRLVIPIPVLTPKLSSYWVDLITPIRKEIARPLVEGLRNEVIVNDKSIQNLINQSLIPVNLAIRKALTSYKYIVLPVSHNENGNSSIVEIKLTGDPDWGGGHVVHENREIIVKGDSKQIWKTIESIGGDNGWYHANFLWKFRGLLDEMLGGPGMSRGRKDPQFLIKNDYVDYWKVVSNKNATLALKAEMKLPGYALLTFITNPVSNSKYVKINQKVTFIPKGLTGIMYWKLLLPIHNYVFNGLIKGISKKAKAKIVRGPYIVSN
jgi:uncharacterized protein YbjT (DUF2867 family)